MQGESGSHGSAALSGRRAGALVAGLTVAAAALRLYHLDHKSLWLDEAICYWASQTDLAHVVDVNRSVRATPPLYAFLIHAVSRFGDSEAWLRAPAWLAGVATVPASYWLGRCFLPAGAAAFVALLPAFAASQVDASQRVSEYALALLLATLVCLAFARFIESPGARTGLPLALLLPLGASLHYGMAPLILGLDLVFLVELRRARSLRRAFFAGVAVHLPLLLAAAAAFYRLDLDALLSAGVGRDGYLAPAYWDGSLRSFVRLGLSHTLLLFEYAHPMGALLLLLVVVGLLGGWREREGRRAALLLLAVFGVAFGAALVGVYPYSARRHMFFLLPPVYLLAGVGFAYLTRLEPAPKARLVAVALVAVVSLGGLRMSLHVLGSTEPEHLRPVMDALAARREPGDAVYVYSWAVPSFRYYEQRRDPAAGARFRAELAEWLPEAGLVSDHRELDDAAALDAALAGSQRTWLVFSHCEVTRCEPLLRRAARLAELETVAAHTDAELYLARPRGIPPASANAAAE